MAATTPSIRLNYGVGKTPPNLPASFQLSPWYDDPIGDCPKRLDITQSGCYLDGQPIPVVGGSTAVANDPFLKTWINNTPNSDDDDNDEELALSFFSPSQPVGPYSWATFEFEEDRSTVIGILAHTDKSGTRLCYVNGTHNTSAGSLPSAPVPALASQNADQNELLTLTFPGLSQATCDVMNDDFSWAMDEQWRSKLMSKTRPDISSGLPATVAADRLTFLDTNAEWFNTVFGPPSLGMQLYEESLPGAKNHVKLQYSLTDQQVDAIVSFLHGPIGSMAQLQKEHLMAARTAHFTQQPRLLLYPTSGPQLLNLLEQANGDQPSVVTFLCQATAVSSFRNPALQLSKRYASLLGAFDLTGALEQQFREDIVAAALLQNVDTVDYTDQAELSAALTDVVDYIQTSPSNSDIFKDVKTALSEVKSVAGLVDKFTKCINDAAKAVKQAGQAKGLQIAIAASDEFNMQVSGYKLGVSTFYALQFGYSTYMSARAYMNWADLTPAQRAQYVINTVDSLDKAVDLTVTITKGVNAITSGQADISAALQSLKRNIAVAFDNSRLTKNVLTESKGFDAKFVSKAIKWVNDYVYQDFDEAAKTASKATSTLDAITKSKIFGAVGDANSVVKEFLGPITSAAAVASDLYSLVSAIKSGAGAVQIVGDALQLTVDTALLVCAVIDAVVDVLAVTVVGLVLVAISIIVTAIIAIIGKILGKKPPLSPPDDYMQNVVFPFAAQVPGAGSNQKQIQQAAGQAVFAVVFRGKTLAAPASGAAATA
jgi:hypothetical protein